MESDKQHRLSKEEIATTGARMLSDLWNNTFQALIDNAGAEKALEFIKPYMKYHGFVSGHLWRKEFKFFSGNDGLSFVTAWITASSFMDVTYSAIEKIPNGYRFDVANCPIGNYTWAHCEVWCAYLANAIVETQFPGCSVSFEEMLTKGDPRCRAVVTDKSVKDSNGRIIKLDLDIQKFPQDFKEYMRGAYLAQLWVYATNALVDYAGPEKAVEMMRPYMRESGMSMGLDFYRKLGITNRDATSIALVIRFLNASLQQKGEVVKSEPNRVEKEITKCPFSNASQDICASLLTIRSNGICEAINREYEFMSEKRMCKGDKTCHWVIKKR